MIVRSLKVAGILIIIISQKWLVDGRPFSKSGEHPDDRPFSKVAPATVELVSHPSRSSDLCTYEYIRWTRVQPTIRV